MKTSPIPKRLRGFTLIELLVTIVLVVVLAGLVFAVSKNVLTKSRLSSSVTKVRDLGSRVRLYTDDHAGVLPVWKNQSEDLYWWAHLVQDYRNEQELIIFQSPGHREFDVKKIEADISYGWNARVVGRTDSAESGADDGPKRVASFGDPSRILVLADSAKTNSFGLLDPQTTMPDPERYDGKAAGLLLDGSGRAFSIEGDLQPTSVWFRTSDDDR